MVIITRGVRGLLKGLKTLGLSFEIRATVQLNILLHLQTLQSCSVRDVNFWKGWDALDWIIGQPNYHRLSEKSSATATSQAKPSQAERWRSNAIASPWLTSNTRTCHSSFKKLPFSSYINFYSSFPYFHFFLNQTFPLLVMVWAAEGRPARSRSPEGPLHF